MDRASLDSSPIGGRSDLDGAVFSGVRTIAQLTVRIISPSPKAAVGLYGKGKVSASLDAFPTGGRADLDRVVFA